MIPIRFADPWALLLLLLPPLLLAAFRYGDRRRRESLARWAKAAGDPSAAGWSRRLSRLMLAAAAAALALALARPSLGPAGPAPAPAPRGGDMVFLLDVSRSMLAADALPNRLARAKAVIGQLAAQARGDRLGLVAFAGSQAVACPLTVDHSFFREMLDEASPASVARGGTLLGEIAIAAHDRASGGDPANVVRITTARFFARNLAPAASGLELAITEGATSVREATGMLAL